MDALILAAGSSTRMGHPKALTPIAGEAALERIAREAAGFRILVVVGEHEKAIRDALPGLDVKWIVNPRPELGRTGSLQRGLTMSRGPGALVLPVDHPLVRGDTMRAIAARPEDWVVPTFQERGGHPLKLGPMGIAAVMSAPSSIPLRDVPAMLGIEVTRVPVDDPGILLNIDTPEDLERLGKLPQEP